MRTANSIYIIENDSLYAFWLTCMLGENTSYHVQDYFNPEAAICDIKKHHPKYILIGDTPQKGIRAQALLLKIKALSSQAMVIVLSAEKNIEQAVDLMRSGAYSFVQKDKLTLQRLLTTIR